MDSRAFELPRQPARIAGLIIAAIALAGCPERCRESAEPIVTGLAQAEQVDFSYLMLAADPAGNYTLPLDAGLGCQPFVFSESALADLLNDKEWQATRTVGGGEVTGTLPFRFEMLAACSTPSEVKWETGDLSVEVTDGDGNVTGRARPAAGLGNEDVRIRLSASGQMEVWLRSAGFNLVGQTTSGLREPGPIGLSAAEIDGALVGRPGVTFTATNALHPYSEAELLALRTSPAGFTGSFSFVAKTAQQAPEILLVFDGDLAVRTDL